MKKVLLLTIISITLFATTSFDIASQLVNDSSKNDKLHLLFPPNSYINSGFANIKQITQILKMNSLFKYSYQEVQDINIKFISTVKTAIFVKAITQAFEQIGVNYYLISEFNKVGDKNELVFNIKSKTIIDPSVLYDALLSMNVRIENIQRQGNDFVYDLNFTNAKIKSNYTLNPNDTLELTKPLDAYFIETNNLTSLNVNIGKNYIWYPKIEFLDNNLNLISTYSSSNNTKELNVAVPKYCSYIILGDKFSLENIKLGLIIKAK